MRIKTRANGAWRQLRALSVAFFVGSVVSTMGNSVYAATAKKSEQRYRTDRILIQPKEAEGDLNILGKNHLKEFHSARGTQIRKSFSALGNVQVIEVPPGTDVETILKEYRASGLVEFAEPDYLLHAFVTPNDPKFVDGSQWGLSNTGQDFGKDGADIHALEAWEQLNTASNIVVAVIDTGIRYTHEDLAANMWKNPGEIPKNGVDDDGNGIVDDVHGINAIRNSGKIDDDNGHGTHVAGIIGAVGNNGKGGVGVAWNVQLMGCKFMDSEGEGSTSDAIQCLEYARTMGAHIVNASWGGPEDSLLLERAVRRARDAGMIVVAAAGNELTDNDIYPSYPCNYISDNVISVAASTRDDVIDPEYSNYGVKTVHLAAPGTDIVSTWYSSDRAYVSLSGTSMAAPMISGVFALMKANFPTESHQQLIKRVMSGVDQLPDLKDLCKSGGRVNLRKSLGITSQAVGQQVQFAVRPSAGIDVRSFQESGIGSVSSVAQITNSGTGTLIWTASVDQPWLSLQATNGVLSHGQSTNISISLSEQSKSLAEGTYSATVEFNIAGGGTPKQLPVRLAVLPLPMLETVPGDVSNQGLQLRLSPVAGYSYVIEASSDLKSWAPVSTNTVLSASTLEVADPKEAQENQKFFRTRLVPVPPTNPAK